METIHKGFKFVLILIVSLTFSNCTAWPALSALFMQSSSGGGGILPLIPGSSSSSPPPAVTPTDTSGSATIQFSTASSSNLETSPNVTIPVTISSAKDATVSYTVTGTATGGGVDYTLADGTLTFTSGGAMTQDITFSVVNDALKETNETVIITLSNPSSSATLGTNTVHTYTITDDDSSTIAFTATSSTAGEGTTAVSIPVSISSTSAATVDYSVTGGTATGSGADYTLASGTLTFTDGGATTQNITFTVVDDALYELDETIIITLANSTGGNLGTNTVHTYTITNDDAMPTVAFTSTSSSGAESVTAPTITVTLSGASALATTVDYAASGASSASGGSDYTLATGTLTFAAGTTSQTIPLTIVNDLNTELNETVIVILSNALNGTLGTSSHVYTIEDNDPPAISFDATSSNGSEATTSITIPVSLNAPYAGTVTVDYSVTGGTATAGGTDFTLANGTLTFASGISSQNITVTIVNDATFESNETFIVTLSNPTSGASLGGNVNHTYTINDDDAPSIAFDATTSTGSEATTAVNIPVSITQTATASVNYAVTGGTATGGGTDYTLASGTLNFTNGGATSQNISVTVNNDALDEADETFTITLSSPSTGVNLGVNTSHTYTITDDDAAPTVAFGSATSNSTDESATSRTIAVNLSAASGQAVSVVVTDLGTGSATSGTDYTAIGSPVTVNFAAGETTKNVVIPVLADTTDENDETINLQLSSPSNATLGGQTTHAFSIIDDDAAPSLSISSPSVNEGNAGTTNLTYVVTLSAASGKTVTVDYATSNGTATTADSDYVAITTTTLTFTPGQTSKNIDVTINGDTKNEVNETVVVTLATPVNSTIASGTGTGTITNDDNPPTVAFTATTGNGNEATAGTVNIPVTLSGNTTAQTVTVDYAVTGTATGGGTDYTLANGTLTFNAGTTSQNISLVVVNDASNESNETVIITLSNPNVATLGTNTVHTYEIIDDDTPSIAFGSASSNGSEATTTVNIPVTISVTATSSMNYSVTGGTATGSGTDFTLASGTVNFTNGGATTQNISITINNDTINETNETIIITLAGGTNANTGAITVHTYTINDNDAAPTVAFDSAASNGNESVTSVNIPVSLTGNTTAQTVTVDYAVTGTATGSGTDFTLANGTLTFNAGTTTQNISLSVNNDTLDEAGETVIVTLSNPTVSALGGTTVHTYTINDDDPTPTVQFTTASQASAGETGTMTITAQLSAVSGLAVSVPFSVNGTSTATATTDYTITASPLSIPAGSTTATITITIAGDTTDENDETVVVDIGSPTNATASGTTSHTATITDDDNAPTVTFAAATSNSTNETATNRTIAINLSAASGKAISVVVTDAGGTATSGTDYTAIGSPLTVSFAAGETTKNVTIPVLSDTLDEADETIILTLGTYSEVSAGAITTHTFSIIDDDAAPTVAFSATTSNGAEATTSVNIPVTLSAASAQTVTVGYSVTGGTATGSGTDFTLASGTLTFTAGVTSQNIAVTVINDGTTEVDETIQITLASPTNSTLGTNTVHTYTINDNDPPTVAFSATTSNGSEATTSFNIPVTLSAAYSQTVTVGYSVTGGTATAGGTDFTLGAGTLTFTAGVTSQNIAVTVVNDGATEVDETIIVTLASPTNSTLGTNTVHTYTINDNDPPTVAFTTTASNATEATTVVNIPVTLSGAYSQTVTVGYSVTGGTATGSGTDFTLASGTLTFTAGVTSQNVAITVNNDVLDEANETIIVTLASPTVATLGTNTAHTYTIDDDDTAPTVAFSATTSNGGEASTSVNIPVTLSAASGQTVTVGYSVTGGTATAGGTDFTLGAGTLTFTAGVTSQNIAVTVVNDGTTELDETIIITLASPNNSTLGTNTVHTYTINDNDPPTVAFTTTTSNGSEATTSFNIPVTLSGAFSQTVTVGYSVTGTATAGGTDFTLADGTLTFTAGVTSQNIAVTVNNDALVEANETIIVTLASPTVATLGTNTVHTYTILDNDSPNINFAAASSSGSETVTSVTIPVNLSFASGSAVTVDYTVSGGGTAAGGGTDFTLANGTLTFAAGVTTQNIAVTVINDALDEANETIVVVISNPTNANLGGTTTHTYTITDDDTPPTVAFSATTSNGSEATTTVNIPVTLSAASGQTVTVGYSVTGGTATGSGTDFTLVSGTLTFNAGVTSQDVSITVVNDGTTEIDETIIVTLASPNNSTLGTNTVHTYTINDNDPPTVAFTTTASNATEATTAVTIPVTLSAAYSQTVTVGYSVTGGTATGSGTDFTLASGTLTFTAGVTSQDVAITVNNDTLDEANETIIVTLASPTVATLGTNTVHTYTIDDNDATPTVAFTGTASNAAESTTAVTIPVTLSAASGLTVTVGYSVTGGTATAGGTDFTLASGTLTFNPGVTSQDVSVTVVNDTTDEPNETIIITLASPTNSTLGTNTAHTYTINDDDNGPTVAFSATTSIGGEATTAVTIPVTLAAASGQTVTVDYSVTGGTATSGGTDFTLASGTLTFTAGVTTQNIALTVVNDTTTEVDETIIITLANPGNSTLGTNTVHTYTINDNDPPTVAFTTTASNATEATTAVTIPVTLSAAYSQTVTVGYSVTGGTATGSGTDFTLASGTLTFTAGVTSQDVAITVVNDTATELNETIVVTLASPTVATLGTNTVHTYTINDNDPPTVAFSGTASNAAEATTAVTIPVTLSAAYANTVTVDYSVTGGTATASGTDFTLTAGTLTFTSGVTSQNISITVNNDVLDEANETIIITLANPGVATLGTNTVHTYTIDDDDAAPTVTFSAATSNSTNETAANRTIALTLSAASGQSVTVAVTDLLTGNATSGTDYTAIANSVTFNPGETTTNITVAVISDTLFEGNETINLQISTPVNATLGAQTTHTFTIIDDELGLTAAETMDCNNNGKIDHYKLTFTAAVTDSTFPGYSANALGTSTTNWLVAGYSNVALRHGTAVAAACAGVTDTVDDTILYINFTEGGSFDTGAKPDVTTTATPTLTGATGSVGQVFTASVTEADRAKPVVITATGTTASANLTVTFSEVVYGAANAPACGSGGQIGTTTLTYTNSNTGGGTTISSMGADTCASADSNAIYVADASFSSGDGDGGTDDTVAATANLYDAANNTGNTTAKALSITAGNPTISSIELYDPNGTGKITQFKVTFSIAMNDATIDTADATRFTLGGAQAINVDTATSGTGSIALPNNDPGAANDAIVTLFTDSTVAGTNLKTVAFTTNAGRWRSGSGFDTLSVADLTSVTLDKAPPIIISAVAAYTNSNLTVDSGDTLTLTFSEPTDKSITLANLTSKLTLSNGHIWGNLTSADWNANGDVLTVTFAGTGSPTIAINDYVTIVDTLKDTASVPNTSTSKISANPISGSFGLDVTKPYLVFASDITTNSVIIQFSEAMRMGGGTANQNADNISNYTLAEDPANGIAGCTPDATFTGGTLTILSSSSVRITLPGGSTFCNTTYRVTVASTVTDLAGNTIGSPDYLTFVGLEAIKVISATALSTNTMRLTFSKPLFTGNNVTHSAACNTTAECALRYKITPAIGDGTISSAVIGADPYSYTVTLTHNGTQSGVAYTVIVANAINSDGFDNASVCVKDIAGTNCVQSAPGDRGTLIGSGTVCNTLACGSFFDDPFFDGTTFSFAFKYDNKIYLGTNDKNDAAFRFDPLGTNSILTTFKFTQTATQTLSCPASIRFGYITSDLSTQTCGTNGGANGEVGAVGFTSMNFTVNSKQFEMLGIGALKNSVDTVYYTQDKDSVLDVRSFGITGGNGTNTKSAQVMYGINDKLFVGIASNHGTNSPVLNRATVAETVLGNNILSVGTPIDMSGSLAPYLGKSGSPANPAANVVGIDFIERVGNSTYMANNGGVLYFPTTSFLTGAKPNNTGQFAANFGPVLSTPSHADFTGTSLELPLINTTTGGGLGKVRPGEKAYPYIVSYNSKLYLARNVGTVGDAKVNLRGELWTCTPNGDGQCAPGGWTRIVTGTETGLPANAKAISMLIANGSNNLYIGFDDPVNGLVVYRYTGTTPGATGGTITNVWTLQGSAGLGSASKYIINSATLYDSATAKNYLYMVVGNGIGSTAIKVTRQID